MKESMVLGEQYHLGDLYPSPPVILLFVMYTFCVCNVTSTTRGGRDLIVVTELETQSATLSHFGFCQG